MNLKAQVTQAHFLQSVMHDRQRSHFLGHEKHSLPVIGGARDDVRNRLRLACSRRPLDNEIAPRTNLLDYAGLRRVRWDHVQQIRRGKPRIERFLRAEKRL
jgi:hypothetical protein